MWLCIHLPEYMSNAAIVVSEHKSHQTTAPWEKGQRQSWEWVQFDAREGAAWIAEGGGKVLFLILQRKTEPHRQPYHLQNKKNVGCPCEYSSQMAVENPCCLHDEKFNRSSRTSKAVCHLRTTHCRGKPIKVIQYCDQSITGWRRWKRKGRTARQNRRDFCSQWKMSVTPTTSCTGKHSLCRGTNKALHTWNFLGHHAALH